MIRLILLFLFTLPSIASAIEGSIVITDITEKYFSALPDKSSKILYQVEADQKHETISSLTDLSQIILQNQARARDRLNYQNGFFSSSNCEIKFNYAYYFQGKLIMEQASGKIKDKKFSAKVIIYNPNNLSLKSNRIYFKEKELLRAKKDYQTSL